MLHSFIHSTCYIRLNLHISFFFAVPLYDNDEYFAVIIKEKQQQQQNWTMFLPPCFILIFLFFPSEIFFSFTYFISELFPSIHHHHHTHVEQIKLRINRKTQISVKSALMNFFILQCSCYIIPVIVIT